MFMANALSAQTISSLFINDDDDVCLPRAYYGSICTLKVVPILKLKLLKIIIIMSIAFNMMIINRKT